MPLMWHLLCMHINTRLFIQMQEKSKRSCQHLMLMQMELTKFPAESMQIVSSFFQLLLQMNIKLLKSLLSNVLKFLCL